MFNEFDRLAKQCVDTIANLHGEAAVWHASNPKRDVTGTVLYKDPSEPVQIGDSDHYEYRPNNVTAEYYTGNFPGLKEAVDNGTQEYMTVRGNKYYVNEVSTIFDGNTYVAHLELHVNEE